MNDDPRKCSVEENQDEYMANMHGIQSAVTHFISSPRSVTYGDNKHMQVGILSTMVTEHAVGTLLIEKGIFTKEEYYAHLALSSRQELQRLTDEANSMYGRDVLRFQ